MRKDLLSTKRALLYWEDVENRRPLPVKFPRSALPLADLTLGLRDFGEEVGTPIEDFRSGKELISCLLDCYKGARFDFVVVFNLP